MNILLMGAEKPFSPGAISGSENRTISLFSLSKAYGFASWRIGYMVIPEHLFVPIQKIQDTQLICPTVIAQEAAIGALDAGKAYCEEKLTQIRQEPRNLSPCPGGGAGFLYDCSVGGRFLLFAQS